jgi:hypothetical protein
MRKHASASCRNAIFQTKCDPNILNVDLTCYKFLGKSRKFVVSCPKSVIAPSAFRSLKLPNLAGFRRPPPRSMSAPEDERFGLPTPACQRQRRGSIHWDRRTADTPRLSPSKRRLIPAFGATNHPAPRPQLVVVKSVILKHTFGTGVENQFQNRDGIGCRFEASAVPAHTKAAMRRSRKVIIWTGVFNGTVGLGPVAKSFMA